MYTQLPKVLCYDKVDSLCTPQDHDHRVAETAVVGFPHDTYGEGMLVDHPPRLSYSLVLDQLDTFTTTVLKFYIHLLYTQVSMRL